MRPLLILFLLVTAPAVAGETLYNGIVLPDEWPPRSKRVTREPGRVPYAEAPPRVIPIDVGRQLFVDDFLIATTNLHRTFHQPEYHSANPVLTPRGPGGEKRYEQYAAPFSGGVCYDPADKLFKMWYTAVKPHSTRYATSVDGVRWEKSELDVRRGTNIVLKPRSFNSTAVWLDLEATNPLERFKYFASEDHHELEGEPAWHYSYRTSADGIHWSEPKARARVWGDRTSAFYNPFREVWVCSQRTEDAKGKRARSYVEGRGAQGLMAEVTYNKLDEVSGKSVHWTGGEHLDPRHTDPRFEEHAPELYNLDAFPYESLMIGQFSIWQGPKNDECGELGLQKRNDILLGYSRDGFHWDRRNRERFISCTWDEKSWRYGNVQSVASGCLVVRDKLYFYFSGHAKPREGDDWDLDASTGLAMLRRDGFASMDAGAKEATLTTRPVTFQGKHLFANVDCPAGELRVELLLVDGERFRPFVRENCEPISADTTLTRVKWRGASDLSELRGKAVRFRFHLRNGSLYSFWVSPYSSGASHGYVGAGGPGFTGATDTVGRKAYDSSRTTRLRDPSGQ